MPSGTFEQINIPIGTKIDWIIDGYTVAKEYEHINRLVGFIWEPRSVLGFPFSSSIFDNKYRNYSINPTDTDLGDMINPTSLPRIPLHLYINVPVDYLEFWGNVPVHSVDLNPPESIILSNFSH
jgi:hypothetical protein